MTDNKLEAWLAERKRIHAAAMNGELSMDTDANGYARPVIAGFVPITNSDGGTSTAIVDAHNHLPALVQGWEAVLRLHQPVLRGNRYVCEHCHYEDGPVVTFPCLTVRALEAVIGDE